MSTGSPNRHLLRLWAVQFLFQRDYNPDEEWEDALETFLDGKKQKPSRKMMEFLMYRLDGFREHQEQIDTQIGEAAANWDLHRMGGVDRNVLRLAMFELLHCSDVPPVVTVNEAVQLAKELSSEESGKFVNGILDKKIRSLDRPLRAALPKEEQ